MAKKALTDQAMEVIAGIMNDPEATVSERLKAASMVLDRSAKAAPPAPKWASLDGLREEIDRMMKEQHG